MDASMKPPTAYDDHVNGHRRAIGDITNHPSPMFRHKTPQEIGKIVTANMIDKLKDDPEALEQLRDDVEKMPAEELFDAHPELIREARKIGGAARHVSVTGRGKLQGITTLHINKPGETPERSRFTPTIDVQRRLVNDVARTGFPDLVKAYTLPTYRNPGNYRSYRLIEEAMIANALDVAARVVSDGYERAEQTVAHVVFGVSLALRRERFPMYFVGSDLVAALLATDLPKGLQFSDVRWPHRAVCFMLPSGSLTSPNGSEIVSISIARIDEAEELSIDNCELSATLPSISGGEKGGVGVWASIIDHHVDTDIHRAGCLLPNCKAEDDPVAANFAMDAPFGRFIAYDADPASLPEIGDVVSEEFLTLIPRLAMNLLLTLAHKPELIEGGGATAKRAKMKARDGSTGKVMVFDPRYLGRLYRIVRERVHQGGTHASPRTHWRRGHWRDVRIGAMVTIVDGLKTPIPKNMRLARPAWIEPILVNATEGGG